MSNVAQFNMYLLAVVKYFSEVTLFTGILNDFYVHAMYSGIHFPFHRFIPYSSPVIRPTLVVHVLGVIST